MKSQIEIIDEIKSQGYAILDSYFDETFCEEAIIEFENILSKKSINILVNEREGTGGDKRLYGIENQSQKAKLFKEDKFINSILRKISKKKLKSHYILAGKITFNINKIKNSGGGWHKDGDINLYKSMLYLNDVNEKNGPFLIIKHPKEMEPERIKSNFKKNFLTRLYIFLGKLKKNEPRFKNQVVEKFCKKNNFKTHQLTAKRGSVVIFDASLIHRGKNIEKGVRYSLTNYYLSSNLISEFISKQSMKNLLLKK